MIENTTRVWVAETDDEGTPYAINTVEDMRGNFDDLVTAGDIDPAETFEGYLDSWARLDMPDGVLADEHAAQAWVAENA